MSKTAIVIARLDEATVDIIDRIVASRGQSRSRFIAQVVTEAARREAEWLAFVQQGIDELDAGKGIANHVVMTELDAMIVRHEARCRD